MKRFKKIFLHVGADKTGSTAIQSTLHQNREILSELGYLYAPELHHILMATYFANQPLKLYYFKVRTTTFDLKKVKEKASQFISKLKSEIEKSASTYLILSYEGFTGLSENELGELKFFLDIYAENIEVIYYLRPPHSYATSAISQRIKYGNPSWHIHPPINLYRPRLTALVNVFGKKNINLRKYESKLLKGGDVVIDFLHQIGMSSDSISKIKRDNIDSNAALSEEAILIGDEVIHLLQGQPLDGDKFNQLFLPTLEKIKGRKYTLNKLQQEVIKRAIKADMKYIRSEFAINIADGIRSDKDALPRMSKETARSIAKIIIGNILPEYNISNIENGDYHEESIIKKAKGKIQYMDELPLKLNAGEHRTVKVLVSNSSNPWWGGRIAPVKASYHWYSSKKKLIEFDGERTELPFTGLTPNESIYLNMNLRAPKAPGEYLLEITLLQEYFTWFERIGFKSHIMSVTVI